MLEQYRQVNWEGPGYFDSALGPFADLSSDEEALWAEFDRILSAAKRGDFSGASRLVSIYDDTDSWPLSSACCDLIGDIGSRSLFDPLRPVVTSGSEPTYSVDFGISLGIWGNLSVVPTLLEALDKLAAFDDARALIRTLSRLLEPTPGPLGKVRSLKNIGPYRAEVSKRSDTLAAQLGTDDVIVLFGERFSVDKLAAVIRLRLTTGAPFDPYLRHKFEATTGVDCSGFYEDGVLQPLRALAILEGFEDNVAPGEHRPGQRYFFGRPVPD